MSRNLIIGREKEKAILELALKSSDPEFIAVYGRRRVGKTHLIREFFGNSICFEIIGKHGATLGEQLENFAQALGRVIGMGLQPQKPSSWSEAFLQLERFLESGVQKKKAKKKGYFSGRIALVEHTSIKVSFLSGAFLE